MVATSASQGSANPAPKVPKGFFGIGPQTALTDRDFEFMTAGGVESIRVPVNWGAIQPTSGGGYAWGGLDEAVATAATHGVQVFPFLYGTPNWLSAKPTKLPIAGQARREWRRFLTAAVERYGRGGDFWAEHSPGPEAVEPVIRRPIPIRNWQIWNEANFFYFAFPASPQRYAKLVKLSAPVIKRADPSAQVVLSGLFGEPAVRGSRGMPATKFLETLYRVRGIKSRFDGIALHPYAVSAKSLERMVEEIHDVAADNRDRIPLFITEVGWGSENNFKQVAFEQGIRGQVKQLRASYRYLLGNRNRLRLKGVFWFSWKDVEGSCSFCDSVGLFRAGNGFRPKPAWRAFVGISGGSVRP